ncbi:hypothetical protein BB559_001548 [Furculomyces boomerangus]|uniref:EamA domain-containing protein n=1 Tax=Furculomyces boomerangus TaxID=61424 RepID=A0A2T9Z1J5_9FUNG|nr:hypothetical protein BB559_001548 [Furculomyces boomerangus]
MFRVERQVFIVQEQNPNVLIKEKKNKLTDYETVVVGLKFSMLWYFASAFQNSSLGFTSVTSSTILSSTSGMFTLFFGGITGVEKVTTKKIVSIVVSFIGVYLITVQQQSSTNGPEQDKNVPNALLGNLLAFASAAIYGLHTTLLKKWSKPTPRPALSSEVGYSELNQFEIPQNEHTVNQNNENSSNRGQVLNETEEISGQDTDSDSEEDMDPLLFLGSVGISATILLWPLIIILDYLGLEKFELPGNKNLIGMLAINAFVGTCLSDYFWVLAVMLTTPLTVTLGLSFTIPLSFLGEILLRNAHYDSGYIIGSVLVIIGFLGVNS